MSDTPRYALVDDRDPQVQYSGDWFRTDSETVSQLDQIGFGGPTFNASLVQSSSNDSSITFSFDGTGVVFYGTASEDGLPTFECLLDAKEMPLASYSDGDFESNNVQLCYEVSIPDGQHNAVLIIKNIDSNGSPLLFDYVRYNPSSNADLNDKTEVIYYDDFKSRVNLSSGWNALDDNPWMFYTSQVESTVELHFEGELVSMYGFILNGTGRASLSSYTLDGQEPVFFDVPESQSSLRTLFNHRYFTISDLEPGQHSLVVTDNTDHKSDSPLGFISFHVIRGSPVQLEAEVSNPSGGTTLSVGEIAGIAIGGAVALALLAALVAYLVFRRRQKSAHGPASNPANEVQWQQPAQPSSQTLPSAPVFDSKLPPVSLSGPGPTAGHHATSQGTAHLTTVAAAPSNTIPPAILNHTDYQYMVQHAYHPPPVPQR